MYGKEKEKKSKHGEARIEVGRKGRREAGSSRGYDKGREVMRDR